MRYVLAALPILLAPALHAEVIRVDLLEDQGLATVTASQWDIGHKDALFDRNWANIYRSASINPAIITVEFSDSQPVGAARVLFANPEHEWTLEAADSLADLDAKTGTYTLVHADIAQGESIDWAEWNDAPVERRVWRFTVERLSGDDYVHIRELELQSPEPVETVLIDGQPVQINIIELTPTDLEIPIGADLQFGAQASLSYGPDRYDVTEIADWTSTDESVAAVSSTGLATPLTPGATTINADIGAVHADTTLGVREPRPADIDVGFIQRTPAYNRFTVAFDGDQHIDPAFLGEQKWPAPGETVTYTAHVFNKGDLATGPFAYRWIADGQIVASGAIDDLAAGEMTTIDLQRPWPDDEVQVVNIPPGAQVLDDQQLERAVGGHTIRFEADPSDHVPEITELNNALEDPIGALAFWIFMDETTYALFSQEPNFLETFSPEDWARVQILGLERRLRVSGATQALRLDNLVVLPDGALDPGGTHGPIGDPVKQADGIWGFQVGEWSSGGVPAFAKRVQNPLAHELGHQIGIIDVYQYDIAIDNCKITRDGQPVAGTPLMPPVSPWNVYYGNQHVLHAGGEAFVDPVDRALMADPARRYVGPGTAAGMERNLGLRRGFFGDYLGAIHQGTIQLRVVRRDGTPVPGAAIRVFQRQLDATVPDIAKFKGATNNAGVWKFPDATEPEWKGGIPANNPWSDVLNANTHDAPHAIGGNAPLVVELAFDDTVEYHFVECDPLNVAMAGGQLGSYTITLVTHESRADNQLPIIDTGAPDVVDITEGKTFTTTVTAPDPDADPVTLRATPLFNSTFDPTTGLFTFTPDSAQVNVYENQTEHLSVTFTADDGAFRSFRELQFRVHDDPDLAQVDEPRMTPPCPADANADGTLDILDFVAFQQAWLAADPLADCNGDAAYSILDFVCYQLAFTAGCD